MSQAPNRSQIELLAGVQRIEGDLAELKPLVRSTHTEVKVLANSLSSLERRVDSLERSPHGCTQVTTVQSLDQRVYDVEGRLEQVDKSDAVGKTLASGVDHRVSVLEAQKDEEDTSELNFRRSSWLAMFGIALTIIGMAGTAIWYLSGQDAAARQTAERTQENSNRITALERAITANNEEVLRRLDTLRGELRGRPVVNTSPSFDEWYAGLTTRERAQVRKLQPALRSD